MERAEHVADLLSADLPVDQILRHDLERDGPEGREPWDEAGGDRHQIAVDQPRMGVEPHPVDQLTTGDVQLPDPLQGEIVEQRVECLSTVAGVAPHVVQVEDVEPICDRGEVPHVAGCRRHGAAHW